jgi:hypothetical protein
MPAKYSRSGPQTIFGCDIWASIMAITPNETLEEALVSLSEAAKLVNAINDAVAFPNGFRRECASPRCCFVFVVGGATEHKKYCSSRCRRYDRERLKRNRLSKPKKPKKTLDLVQYHRQYYRENRERLLAQKKRKRDENRRPIEEREKLDPNERRRLRRLQDREYRERMNQQARLRRRRAKMTEPNHDSP